MKSNEIAKLMLKIEDNKDIINRYTRENKKLTETLINKMVDKKIKNYAFEDNDDVLNVTIVERNNVEFNLDILKEKLGKELYKKITDKDIEIDKAELREILRNNHKIKIELKPALIIKRVVNEDKLKKMLQDGEIDKEVVKEACNITNTKYLRLERKIGEK